MGGASSDLSARAHGIVMTPRARNDDSAPRSVWKISPPKQFVAQTGLKVFDEAILPRVAGVIDTKPVVGEPKLAGEVVCRSACNLRRRAHGGGRIRRTARLCGQPRTAQRTFSGVLLRQMLPSSRKRVRRPQTLPYPIDYLGDFGGREAALGAPLDTTRC